jgi:hypothetical protein
MGMVVAHAIDPREIYLHLHTIPAKIKNSINTAMGDMGR